MSRRNSWKSALICGLSGLLLGALPSEPLMAKRPPEGFARPPFALKGTSGGTSSAPAGLSPQKVRHAYGFDLISNQGAGQTIGIVDAYDDPYAESDLGKFNSMYALPVCTSSNGCFKKFYASGSKPSTNAGWALEISLDVQWAHAIAPQAKIILVEAASNKFTDLLAAVDVAVKNGATVVSMSFGGAEFSGENTNDTHFSVNGVTFVASSGDSGYGVEYPASASGVMAVGGTTLTVDASGNYLSETAWSGSGGGLSAYEFEPLFQATYPITNDPGGMRGVPDVAYNGDPNTGFAVYDSVAYNGKTGWFVVGGTSAGTPQWAALIAIANSMRVAGGKARLNGAAAAMYALAQANYGANFHDVSAGANGTCGTLCTATPIYDYVTGLGTPRANNLIPALVSQP